VYRILFIAGSVVAVTIGLLIALLLAEDWKKKAEDRRFEAMRGRASTAQMPPPKPAPPPLPPAIDPAEVARLKALGKPRRPRGQKDDYTWQQVEATLEGFRSERKQRPQALDDLESWYNFLADPWFTASDDIPQHLAKMEAWRKEVPDSTTPLVVSARAHIKHAWEARGGGFAGTVTPEGWQLFHERIAAAKQLLEEAIEAGVKDGQAYALMIMVAKAEGWPRSQVDAVIEAGQKVDSGYTAMYTAMAEYLLPRWHGERGDIEAFAAQVVQDVPGDDGLEAYAKIAYTINQYEPELLFFGKYDRKLLGQAAEVAARRYPYAPNLVPFAALCTVAAQDHQAARRVQPFVQPNDEVTRVPGWERTAKQYFSWCDARTVPTGESDFIWAARHTYGNIAFDTDSRYIWCGQGWESSPVALFDIQEKEIHLILEGPRGQINELAFDHEKRWVAAAILGTDFRGWVLWNTKNPDEPIIQETETVPTAIAINSTSNQLALAVNQTVRLITIPTLEEGPKLEYRGGAHFLRFSPDGKLLAINETILDCGTGETRYKALGTHVAFDDQQRSLVTYFLGKPTGNEHPLYRYAADGQTKETLIADLGPHGHAAALSPDGKLLAFAGDPMGGGAEDIGIWDLSTQKLHKRLGGHWRHIGTLAFSSDGKKLASIALMGGPIKIWSLDE
jgi:hypothetical protein